MIAERGDWGELVLRFVNFARLFALLSVGMRCLFD